MTSVQSQTPAPAGFAAFLATIGQTPAVAAENGGFEQLLAAAPFAIDAAVKTAAAVKGIAPTGAGTPLPGEGVTQTATDLAATIALIDGGPAKHATAKPVAEAVIEGPDDGAAAAANLLFALIGAAPEKSAGAAIGAPGIPALVVAAAAPAIATPEKAAKPASTPAPAASTILDTSAQAAPAPAKAPAAPPQPSTAFALAGSESPRAAPLDATPSMTILFTQAAAQGPAPVTDAAQPIMLAERVLDLGSDDVWIQQLARDIAATKTEGGDISFRLMPRHLGRLDVAMRMEEGGVSLTLDTRHEATATIVTAAQGRLVEDLRQQGVRVAEAHVTCTPNETGRQSQQGQGRSAPAPDASHLIETAAEHPETHDDERAADRRGRFA